VEELRLQEIFRAVEVEMLAHELGLPSDTTLAQLSETADEPWSMLFAEHRNALRALVLETQAIATEVSDLLAAGGRAMEETLDHLGLTTTTYDRGERGAVPNRPRLLDRHA
jgi:hypothetical protein